jgi:hypothetical protein
MNLALAGVAAILAAGAVLAVSVREIRLGTVGLTAVLVAAALIQDPLPGPAVLGVRVVGALLVVALLRSVAPQGADDGEVGSHLGWPSEALIAAAAACAGLGIAVSIIGLSAELGDPTAPTDPVGVLLSARALGSMTGAILLTLGATPGLLSRSAPRRTMGLLLMTQGAILIRTALAGTPGDLEQLAIVGLLLACGVTGMAITRAAIEAETEEDRELITEGEPE